MKNLTISFGEKVHLLEVWTVYYVKIGYGGTQLYTIARYTDDTRTELVSMAQCNEKALTRKYLNPALTVEQAVFFRDLNELEQGYVYREVLFQALEVATDPDLYQGVFAEKHERYGSPVYYGDEGIELYVSEYNEILLEHKLIDTFTL